MQVLLAVLCVGAAMQQVGAQRRPLWAKRPMRPQNFSSDDERKMFDEASVPHIDGTPTGNVPANPKAGRMLYKIRANIVGGNKASKGMFPWQVAIESGDGSAFCGGSLITLNAVLTAGHCVKGVKSVKISLGVQKLTDKKDGRVVMKSRKKVVHSGYSSEMLENDIAIIKLPRKVTIGEFINTVRLPTVSEAANTNIGAIVTATGWGFTKDKGKVSEELRFLDNKSIIPNSKCAQHYGKIKSTQICIDGQNKQAICSGDSGGPLTMKDPDGATVLIGIVSFSHPDTCVGYPQVFTRVASYLKWISQNTGIEIAP